MKVMNFALVAALAAGLLFFSIRPLAAGQPLADAPSAAAALVEPAPADRPAQDLTASPIPLAAVAIVVVLFGVLALFPMAAGSQGEGGYDRADI